jgi:hypothetical protein
MSAPSESDVATVAQYFIGMGAEDAQAKVMANQLLKRAIQLSEERKISLVEATQNLLKQIATARKGLAPSLNKEVKRKDDLKS